MGFIVQFIENEKLSLEEKIEVRDYANQFLQKTFNFLQIKDPFTYFRVSTLGKELTVADEKQVWNEIRKNQENILKDKRIKHRSFGIYSKHICLETCHWNGLMIRQGSVLAESNMYFDSDKSRCSPQSKSLRNKKDRKKEKQIIQELIEIE